MYNFEYIVEKFLWCSDEGYFVWGDTQPTHFRNSGEIRMAQ